MKTRVTLLSAVSSVIFTGEQCDNGQEKALASYFGLACCNQFNKVI